MSNSVNFGRQLLAVGVGGIVGATGRYSVSLLFAGLSGFPYATLTVNLIGCFFLSYLLNHSYLKRKLHQAVFIALGTGMIGSFTTFSTFAIETTTLFQANPLQAILYICLSMIGGLLFCFLGFKAADGRRVNQ